MRAGDALARMTTLPLADLDAVAPGTSLILAPHPDDETLGCGGLIAQASARGRPPLIVVVTDGTLSHPNSITHPAWRLRALRQAETRAAASILGVADPSPHFMGMADTKAPSGGTAFDRAVREVVMLAEKHRISTLFATWRHDPHADHQATAAIAAAAARIAGVTLKYYPVWGWRLPADLELPVTVVAGARLSIAGELPAKRRAIAAYASQLGLIQDDPAGFTLPPALLADFDRPFEVFLDP